MRREKYQRPKVKAVGTVWRVQYREYFTRPDGGEDFHHRSRSWIQSTHTKKQAQAAADQIMLEMQQGPPKADGSMTLHQFWETIYLPIRKRKWHGSTEPDVVNKYTNHIQPVFGPVALRDINKVMIELHLGNMADARLGKATVEAVRIRLHSILAEALDNDYIVKNPARKIETPECKPSKEPRSLTEDEVRALWDGTEGMDYLFWRIKILTGARIGEVLPLERADLRPDGLMIDEAVVIGKVKLPKREKVRLAAIPESLRAELEEWLTGHDHRLFFPTPRGKVYARGRKEIQQIAERGREIIPDLTFRMCRTTFASLFEGDAADRSSIMGHTSEAFTLARYRKPIMERRQRSVEELDKRLKVVRINQKRHA